jgi:hypothetical protein
MPGGRDIAPRPIRNGRSSENDAWKTNNPEENTPRTPVSPVEGTRELSDKPNFKETNEPWKKPTEDSHDGHKLDLEKSKSSRRDR